MKKVLVLVAVAMLLAVPAFSAVKDTKHDLSSTNSNGSASNTDQVCVFCHTPHGATAAGTAPLWNSSTTNAITVYGNPAGTMNATAATLISVNATDAILCLSCHDGSIGTLTNPPNALGGAQPTVTATVGAAATIGTDLSNDHPIGIIYDTALVTADGQLNAPPTAMLFVGATPTVNDTMWCSSCHDVHGVTGVPTFLRSTNAGSALCTTCHVK